MSPNDLVNSRLEALRSIHDHIFLSSSIDNFIDRHSQFPLIEEMGKLMILFAISQAERNSKLYVKGADTQLDFHEISKSWIDPFFRILIEKIRIEDIDEIGKNLTIICFNYDRCIEHYLTHAIHRAFIDVTVERAHGIVQKMDVIHPYGTIGEPPGVPFGRSFSDGFDPWSVLDRIKTYTEQVGDENILSRIRGAVNRASQIIFLGFAFHPQNMALMQLDEPSSAKNVYSTGRGISYQEAPEIMRRIVKLYAPESKEKRFMDYVQIEHNASCADLFGRHWRNLSLA